MRLELSLLQEELNMCVIVVIANNQAGFHQFIDEKLLLIEFFDHDFKGLSSYALFGCIVENVVHENLVFHISWINLFFFLEFTKMIFYEAG